MGAKQPRHRIGPKRPSKPKHVGTPSSLSLDRSFAQKVRTDRTLPNYETPAKRAAFWAKQQAALAANEQAQMDQSVAQISQGTPKENTQFRTANIRAATLQSAPPTLESQQSLLGPGGIAPPPPAP